MVPIFTNIFLSICLGFLIRLDGASHVCISKYFYTFIQQNYQDVEDEIKSNQSVSNHHVIAEPVTIAQGVALILPTCNDGIEQT
jgi:hypothetical protein